MAYLQTLWLPFFHELRMAGLHQLRRTLAESRGNSPCNAHAWSQAQAEGGKTWQHAVLEKSIQE